GLGVPDRPRARAPPRLLAGRAGGERGDGTAASGPGPLRLRRLGPLPAAGRPDAPEAAARALPRDAVRAPALLPVRPRGRLARARLRQRLVRPLADDPARVAARRDAPPGAGAGAGLEAALRLRRRPHARALLPRCEVVAGRARRGAAGTARRRSGGGGTADPARERTRAVQLAGCLLNRGVLSP